MLFVVLAIMIRAGALRRPGLIVGSFAVLYGLARITGEFFREPDPQPVQAELARTDPVERRQPAAEHEVAPLEAGGLLDRQDLRGRLHHAEQAGIPGGIGAEGAGILRREEMAGRAGFQLLANVPDGPHEGLHVLAGVAEAADLAERWDLFTSFPTPVVVDHMGRPDVTRPVDGPEFARFMALMREHPNVWSKVSCPERLSASGPPALGGERHPYRDVVPFARRLVEAFPDRVLWGTDWPHPNMKSHMPDEGDLVDLVPRIAPTEDLRRRLLVDNPMRLYWEAS